MQILPGTEQQNCVNPTEDSHQVGMWLIPVFAVLSMPTGANRILSIHSMVMFSPKVMTSSYHNIGVLFKVVLLEE